MKPIEVLMLSREDVMSLEIPLDEVVRTVAGALVEHDEGRTEMHLKMGVHPTGTDPSNFIHAMPAYLPALRACGMKWVAGFQANPARYDLPNVTGVYVHNDPETGIPVAIMDASYLTELRTGAVAYLAAKHTARAGAARLAIVGTGRQGAAAARFFAALWPCMRIGLKSIRNADLRGFIKENLSGYSGTITQWKTTGRCLAGAEVILTCTNGDRTIVSDWAMEPGAAAVGLEGGGGAYSRVALHSAEKFITDDIKLAEYFDEIGKDRKTADGRPDPEYPGGLPRVHATLGAVVGGRRPGRERADERVITIPVGLAVCDVALGAVIWARARACGKGTKFRLA